MNLSDLLLTAVINYGVPAVGISLLIGALGIPLPSSLVVIAGGAFVRQGMLNPAQAFSFGLVGAVVGDMISFGIGRFARHWTEKRFGGSNVWLKAKQSFDRYGGLSIYLTRWLLTSIAIPVNLIAGSSGYAFRRFLIYDIAGEATWLVLFGGLGYAFGSQWEAISQFLSDFGGLFLGIVLLAGGVYIAIRLYRKK